LKKISQKRAAAPRFIRLIGISIGDWVPLSSLPPLEKNEIDELFSDRIAGRTVRFPPSYGTRKIFPV
jgi:hypothetical protein